VHVDVDDVRRDFDEEDGQEAAVTCARRAIGLHHGPREGAVTHGAPVDEQPQLGPRRPRAVGPGDEAADDGPVGATLDRHQGLHELRAEELDDAGQQALGRRRIEQQAPRRAQGEAGAGACEGELGQRLGDVRGLGRRGAQELAPRGHRAEQVAHLHRRAAGVARVPHVPRPPVLDGHLGAGAVGLRPRAQQQLRDGGDRRQRLASEAVRGDRLQVRQLSELRGRVPFQRQRGVLARHAAAIVAHADESDPAILDLHVHRAGGGVERVLDQLLDHGRRALDHLSGGDLVDEVVREPLDGRHWCSLSYGPCRTSAGTPASRSRGSTAPSCSRHPWRSST
jgi:hypothetical protein